MKRLGASNKPNTSKTLVRVQPTLIAQVGQDHFLTGPPIYCLLEVSIGRARVCALETTTTDNQFSIDG